MRHFTATFVVLFAAAGTFAQETVLGVDGTRLLRIDPTNGQTTQLATLDGGGTIGALAYDPTTDTLYATSSSLDQLFKIDRESGHVTLIGGFNRQPVDPVMHGMEFYPPGNTLLGVDFRDKALVDIDPESGQATLLGITPLTGFGSLAWDARAGKLFGGDSTTDSLWEIDPANGAGRLIGPFNAPDGTSLGTGMAWSSTYGILAINNGGTDNLFRIDAESGAATLIGVTGTSNMLGIAVIPEPAGLCSLALLAAAGLRRRR